MVNFWSSILRLNLGLGGFFNVITFFLLALFWTNLQEDAGVLEYRQITPLIDIIAPDYYLHSFPLESKIYTTIHASRKAYCPY